MSPRKAVDRFKAARKFVEQFAGRYQHLRGSVAGLVIITAWVGGALLLHFAFGWDKDWGATNLQFSIEALYNGVFLAMLMERIEKMRRESEARHTKQLEYIADMTEAILAMDDRKEK